MDKNNEILVLLDNDTAYINSIPGLKKDILKAKNVPDSEFITLEEAGIDLDEV